MLPHRGFIFQSGESPLALLEGVTITAGLIPYNSVLGFSGGAIFCKDGSSPTIRNCRLTQCEAVDHGGGLAFSGDDSIVMSGCLLVDNYSSSGFDGLVLTCPTSLIYKCTFTNHNNVAIFSEYPATISNCTIINNGTGVFAQNSITMENSLIAFNEIAFHETAISQRNLNCNNVFGNDTGDYVDPIQLNENINGNISQEPFLCDPDNWDFHVSPDSPCLDALCGQIGAFGAGECALVSAVEETPEVSFGLRGNHPNPFNPSTVISYYLERDSSVKLQVYDISGKLVRTLADESSVVAGQHDVIWNGFDDRGQRVAAGVFLYVLTTPSGRDVGRMALIK